MCCNMKQRNYNTLPCGVLPADICHKKAAENTDTSELSRLLKIVYAADKRTGLPSGELSVLASDSVPPEVAQWVRTQLLNPIPDNSVSSILGNTQLDDDTIIWNRIKQLSTNPLSNLRGNGIRSKYRQLT